MTTIAYRDGMIAADRAVMSANGTILGETEKIAASRDGQIIGGAAGSSPYCAEFLVWIIEDCNGPPPRAAKDGAFGDQGFIVREGRIEVYEAGGASLVDCDYFAIGTGRCEALGAMFVGACAQDAVRAALKHDSFTGVGMDFIQLPAAQRSARGQ
jgi:hypothetical protein